MNTSSAAPATSSVAPTTSSAAPARKIIGTDGGIPQYEDESMSERNARIEEIKHGKPGSHREEGPMPPGYAAKP